MQLQFDAQDRERRLLLQGAVVVALTAAGFTVFGAPALADADV